MKEKSSEQPITAKKIRLFLNNHTHDEGLTLTEPLREGLKNFIAKCATTLIDSEYFTTDIPSYWSDIDLIKNAHYIKDYQEFLLHWPKNEKFTDRYIELTKDKSYANYIEKNIKNGNLFISYVHVVKLFRAIKILNQMANKDILSIPNRFTLLSISYQELNKTINSLSEVQNEENRFWSTALITLGKHALASIHYNVSSFNLYNLCKSKILLKEVIELSYKGDTLVQQIEDYSIIDFFTLKGSLIPTLPYSSFAQEREDVLKLDIWEPGELDSSLCKFAPT